MKQPQDINIGDKVTVKNTNGVYAYYDKMAGLMNLTTWETGAKPSEYDKTPHTVIDIKRHSKFADRVLAAIESDVTGRQYIFDMNKLWFKEKGKPKNHFDEELFTL